MRKRMQWIMVFFIAGSMLALFSCNNNTAEQASVKLFLTDAPATYDAVNVDIQEVQLNIEGSGWVSFSPNRVGVYNLLNFSSGIDTLLLSTKVKPGKISQIRLILGGNNSVVVGGVYYALETPSAEESGLHLNVHYDLKQGEEYNFWLDFDAEQSIVEQGSGDYSLKPVIRVYTEAETGTISGSIFPINGAVYVAAINENDTVGTYISNSGTFQLVGLKPGTYNVSFGAGLDIIDLTVPGVSVAIGTVTNMGVVLIP